LSPSARGKHSGIPSLNFVNCHKNIAEVAELTEYSSILRWANSKLYKAVGWDQTTQSYTGKKPVNGFVFIIYLILFQSLSARNCCWIECQTCHGPVETYEIQNNLLH
jgi:hypothetical protein